SINHLTLGNGKIKVLMWSQMHGDESTATMALFDLFNFFSAHDEFDSFRKEILDNLELHFVPMINPDGAQVWQRRNVYLIDINRDARNLVTPEGRILKGIGSKLKPDFGFNLHDQGYYTTVGLTKQHATISFLAPAYNYEKDVNEVRKRALQLIVTMNRGLQIYAPGKVARYDDEHDPRCFGDQFQGMGISTILIESGGYPQDPEKQFIRKLNFYALLSAFQSIIKQSYATEKLEEYTAIPENSWYLYDLIVRNVKVTNDTATFISNLGIYRSQRKNADYKGVYYEGTIADMGDIDAHFSYEDKNAEGLTFTPGKIKDLSQKEWEVLTLQQEYELVKQGFLFVKWKNGIAPKGQLKKHLLNLSSEKEIPNKPAGPGQSANFLLTKDNVPVYAVINGYWIDLSKEGEALVNTMSY
ncbi:MAG TPA: M14 family zinc carboxypeptidase, partial [Cyclobacteriaceae bacterium]